MLIDSRSRFANSADITGAAGTAKIGLAMDLGIAASDMGEGNNLFFVVQTDAAVVGSTSVEFQLVTADNVALTTNPVVILSTGAVAVASLTADKRIMAAALPKADYKHYLGLRIVRVGTNVTAGSVTAFLTDHAPSWRAYPEGMN